MVIDQIIKHVPKAMLIRLLKEELASARTAVPFPHLAYQTGFSFTEKMHLRKILPSDLGTNTQELATLERAGSELTIRNALKQAIDGDLLLDDVYGLIRFARKAMNRTKMSLDTFHVEASLLHRRECAYWQARGEHFANQLRACEGVRQSMEARTWYLHEIRLAMRMGMLEKKEIGLEQSLHLLAVRHLYRELADLYTTAQQHEPESKARFALTQRYNYLIWIAQADLQEFAE